MCLAIRYRRNKLEKSSKKIIHISKNQHINSVNFHISDIEHIHDLTVNFLLTSDYQHSS